MLNSHDSFVQGKTICIREVDIADAIFIHELRLNEKKSEHIHKIENNIQLQIDYIANYKRKKNEWYFIIEDKKNLPIGTYRIYDVREDSFCIGSWLMLDTATAEQVFESDFLVRNFGFALGFEKIHFDVRKTNKKVIAYHKMMGAKIVSEDDLNYYWECTKLDYIKNSAVFLKK